MTLTRMLLLGLLALAVLAVVANLGKPTPTFANVSFSGPTNFAAGSGPSAVAMGDFDRDGVPDLAVANEASGNVSVLLGNGAGSFGAATNFGVGTNPRSVAIGDLNLDGVPDLATANSGSNNVSVLLGDGAGSFGAATNFAVGTSPRSVTIGDLDRDGRPDLAVANEGSANVSVLLGNGAGSFGAATSFAAGIGPSGVAMGDFDRDGRPDLAVANEASGNVSVLLGTGAGSFGAATNFAAGIGPSAVAIGDLNADGKLDLAAANRASNNVSVLLGNGSGSFGAATNFAVGTQPGSVGIGDIDRDGKPDLATANEGSNNVSILLNTTVPDLDGDGVPDTSDNCPATANPLQQNNVHPGTTVGDHCEDPEPDGVMDIADNCPNNANPGQENNDGDALGDACDPDNDNDGVPNVAEGQCRNATDNDLDGRVNDGCPQRGSISEASIAGACDIGNAVNDDFPDDNRINDGCPGFTEIEACGSNDLDGADRPERLDGPFDNVDDDADTEVDEALPSGSETYDCDGDGWKGSQEMLTFGAGTTANDQDACGNNGWGLDLAANNIVNIQDLNSFLSPNRPVNDGHGVFNKFGHPLDDDGDTNIDPAMARWNLQTPPHDPTTLINIGDLNSLINGAEGSPARPPMFGGQPAFFTNGGMCPWPP